MVRHARAMVQSGELGPIRQLHVEYIQGNLARPTEADREPAANWRFVAELCGASLVLGDIGTHAHHLASFIIGLELTEVAAELAAWCRGGRCTTMATCCCASRVARAARCG